MHISHIITSRHSARFELGNNVGMYVCVMFNGGSLGQPAVNHMRNNMSTTSIIGIYCTVLAAATAQKRSKLL